MEKTSVFIPNKIYNNNRRESFEEKINLIAKIDHEKLILEMKNGLKTI